jgi:hypothetical protein
VADQLLLHQSHLLRSNVQTDVTSGVSKKGAETTATGSRSAVASMHSCFCVRHLLRSDVKPGVTSAVEATPARKQAQQQAQGVLSNARSTAFETHAQSCLYSSAPPSFECSATLI